MIEKIWEEHIQNEILMDMETTTKPRTEIFEENRKKKLLLRHKRRIFSGAELSFDVAQYAAQRCSGSRGT
jgi:hypothetical protein